MPATPESRTRTRAFARVIGPFLTIVAIIVAVRMPNIGPLVASFFDSPMLVWMKGAMLLLGGVFIIANHQYWSGLSAILISLFGWFLALRGVVLLAAPQLIQRGAAAAQNRNLMPVAEVFFGLLVLIGLWLTFEGWFARHPAAS
jgi:hypothetical protein